MIYKARPHQLRVLQSQKRFVFLGAGIGAGKTDVGALWMLNKVLNTPKGTIGLICANTYPQLFDATLRNLYKNLERFGATFSPKELPSSFRPVTLKIWNGSHFVEVLCRSMDAYENLSGTEVGWFWMDEVWQTEELAFNTVTGRLRGVTMQQQGLLTTTLDDPSSWLYRVFVENYDRERMEVIYATTYDNEINLGPDYIPGLKLTYSPQLFKRNVLAMWVPLESGLVYYAFDRKVHVRPEAEHIPGLPIYWTLDFNIGQDKPMSSCLGQVKRVYRDGVVQQELHIFDEIILDTSDTHAAIEECKNRLAALNRTPAEVIVYGDASGKHGDSRSRKTDYVILSENGFIYQNVPEANPPLRDGHNSVNSLLKNEEGQIRLLLHDRCRVLAKGLETVKLKKGAQYVEEQTREQHVTSALRYLVHAEFPVLKPPSARAVGITMGGK